MGIENAMAITAVMMLGAMTLQGECRSQITDGTARCEIETDSNATEAVINIHESIDIPLDKERQAESFLLEGMFPACNYDLLGYSVIWSEGFTDYGEGRNGQMLYIDYRAGRRGAPIEELSVFQNMLDMVGITDTEDLEWDEVSLANAIMEQNPGIGEEEAEELAARFMQAIGD